MRNCINHLILDCNGHTISGTGATGSGGILLSGNRQNVEIGNCVVKNFANGIVHFGNGLEYHNTYTNNLITENIYGLYLDKSRNNTLAFNNVSFNTNDGFLIFESSRNTFINNVAANQRYGFNIHSSIISTLTENIANLNIEGIRLVSSDNSKVINNTVNFNSNYGIHIRTSNSVLVYANIANSNSDSGILIEQAPSNTISDNYLDSNFRGIKVSDSISQNNIITNNTVISNNLGIFFNLAASSNKIYNNFFENADNALEDSVNARNTWNITLTPGTNIIGGPYIGGNFWNDYNGMDNNGDGIGDTNLPYNPGLNEGDFLPLIFSTPTFLCGDIITNDTILVNDLVDCPADGLIIGGDNIELDCDGYTISGTGSGNGISLPSRQNVVVKNCVVKNFLNGISLTASSNNLIYNNHFENTNNAIDDSVNTWSLPKMKQRNIINGPITAGNFWSDYLGQDLDGDGIGDTLLPYNSNGNIQNGGDSFPLVYTIFVRRSPLDGISWLQDAVSSSLLPLIILIIVLILVILFIRRRFKIK